MAGATLVAGMNSNHPLLRVYTVALERGARRAGLSHLGKPPINGQSHRWLLVGRDGTQPSPSQKGITTNNPP